MKVYSIFLIPQVASQIPLTENVTTRGANKWSLSVTVLLQLQTRRPRIVFIILAKIPLTILLSGCAFYLARQDNGIGCDPQEVTGRNAIRNIKGRVERWQGTFYV